MKDEKKSKQNENNGSKKRACQSATYRVRRIRFSESFTIRE